MVIWPKKVSPSDQGWQDACALLQVLALDPRRPIAMQKGRNRIREAQRFYESADEYLIRPTIYVDRQPVLAPYVTYDLRFAVSATVIGSIPIDSESELVEFNSVLNSALQSPFTTAERKKWIAEYERIRCIREKDPMPDVFSAAATDENRKSMRWYNDTRAAIEEPRTGEVRASISSHEEVLRRLIQLGAAMQKGELRREA